MKAQITDRQVKNLKDLLLDLDDMGVISFADCGSYITVHFDREVNTWGDKLSGPQDIRFYADDEDYLHPKIDAEVGSCANVVDVYLSSRK